VHGHQPPPVIKVLSWYILVLVGPETMCSRTAMLFVASLGLKTMDENVMVGRVMIWHHHAYKLNWKFE